MDTNTILGLWNTGAETRSKQAKRRSYYRGENEIEELKRPRLDGRPRGNNRTNWVEYVSRMHRGFLTYHPAIYTVGGEDSEALADFTGFRAAANLDALDGHHFENCLLYGFSAEAVNVTTGPKPQITVTELDPWNVVPVFNEGGELSAAVVNVLVEPGTYFEGKLVEAPRRLIRYYTPETVTTIEMQADGKGDKPLGAPVVEANSWGAVPITVFAASRDRASFFTDRFLGQCDNYDVLASSLDEDVNGEADSMLALEGISVEDMLARDANGVSNIEKLKAAGVLPLPAGAKAGYVSRTIDTDKFKKAMAETRFSIHLQGCIPDLDNAIGGGEGTITNISGIALTLLYHTMIQQSAEFERWFAASLRRRVDLWNSARLKLGRQPLEGYEVKLKRNIPKNGTEVLQYLANLKEVLAPIDLLKMVPEVDSPEDALARFEAAKAQAAPVPKPIEGFARHNSQAAH